MANGRDGSPSRSDVECGELILRFGYRERCWWTIEGSITSHGASKAVNQFPALQQNKITGDRVIEDIPHGDIEGCEHV